MKSLALKHENVRQLPMVGSTMSEHLFEQIII